MLVIWEKAQLAELSGLFSHFTFCYSNPFLAIFHYVIKQGFAYEKCFPFRSDTALTWVLHPKHPAELMGP